MKSKQADLSCYVDQWDWEKVVTPQQRYLDYLRSRVGKIWSVIYEASQMVTRDFPELGTDSFPATASS